MVTATGAAVGEAIGEVGGELAGVSDDGVGVADGGEAAGNVARAGLSSGLVEVGWGVQ